MDVRGNETASVETSLEVDVDAPAIQARLRSPALAGVAGFAGTVLPLAHSGYLGFGAFRWPPSFSEPVPVSQVPAFAVTGSLYPGHLYAGETQSALLMSAISLGTTLAGAAISYLPVTGTAPVLRDLSILLTYIPPLVLHIWDVAASPAAVTSQNAALLERVAETGVLPAPPEVADRFVFVETGGGALVRAGYRLNFGGVPLDLEVAAALSLASTEPVGFGAGVLARLSFAPLAEDIMMPTVLAQFGLDTDLAHLGAWLGPGVGARIDLGLLELNAHAAVVFGLSPGAVTLQGGIGVAF